MPRFEAQVHAARLAHVELPTDLSRAFTLTEPKSGVRVSVALRDATPAPAEEAGGMLLYREGNRSVVHRAHSNGTEDYVEFATRPAEEALRYRVTLEQNVKGLRAAAGTGSVELLDSGGTPRLRVTAARGLDAWGESIPLELKLEGCAADTSEAAPWGKPVTNAGASECEIVVRWRATRYPVLIDPAWTATGDMAAPRQDHVAVLLKGGRVLVAGGTWGPSEVQTAELYDPLTATWAVTGSTSGARSSAVAVRLPSGKVLVAGGGVPFSATAELYDEAAGTFTATASMTTERREATASLLASGKVLVTGGRNLAAVAQSSAELYDPVAGAWAVVPAMATPRGDHEAVVLPGGKVLLTGGQIPLGQIPGGPVWSSAELYDPGTNIWSAAASMSSPRREHRLVVLPSGKVLAVGGVDNGGELSSAELYDPTTNAWSSLPAMGSKRQAFTATLLPTGNVLVAGGWDGGGFLAATELFDSVNQSWQPAAPMRGARNEHTATLLPSGDVLVSGAISVGSSSVHSISAEVWTTCTPDCGAYACAPVTKTCKQSCVTDLDCAGGNACAGGACVPATAKCGVADSSHFVVDATGNVHLCGWQVACVNATCSGGTGGTGGGGSGGTSAGGAGGTSGSTSSGGTAGSGQGGGVAGTVGVGGSSGGQAGAGSGGAPSGGGNTAAGGGAPSGGGGISRSDDESGCGCRVPRAPARAPGLLVLVVAAALLVRRRRRFVAGRCDVALVGLLALIVAGCSDRSERGGKGGSGGAVGVGGAAAAGGDDAGVGGAGASSGAGGSGGSGDSGVGGTGGFGGGQPEAGVVCNATWKAMPTTGAPTARHGRQVWTGSELIVWGGSGDKVTFGDGARFDPATMTWTPMSSVGAPSPRTEHAMFWTGSEVLIWSGQNSGFLGDGARYDPKTDSWKPISTVGAPQAGYAAVQVWTGQRMVIWGGFFGTQGATTNITGGAMYDPQTDTWSPVSNQGAPGHRKHTTMAGAADGKVYVVGGCCNPQFQKWNDAWRLDPIANTWTKLPAPSLVSNADRNAFSFAVGSKFLLWGGSIGLGWPTDGEMFDPLTGAWTILPFGGAPNWYAGSAAVDDHSLFAVGCEPTSPYCETGTRLGALYDFASATWALAPMPDSVMPKVHLFQGVHRVGCGAIVWGGSLPSTGPEQQYSNDGALWLP